MLRRFAAQPRQQEQQARFTCRRGVRLDGWQQSPPHVRRSVSPGAAVAPQTAAWAAAAAASLGAAAGHAGRSGTSSTRSTRSTLAAAPKFDFELDIADLLVGRSSKLVQVSRHAVHEVERLEQRLQRRAAALPAGMRRLLAGGLAGAAGKTSTAPLESVKMQLVQAGGLTSWQAARGLWQRGGVRAFFRGNSVDVLRTIPSRAIELSSFEWYKRVLRRWNRKHNDELHVPDNLVAAVAGGLAGVTSSLVVYPLETARTRMALGAQGNFLVAMAGITRAEGVGALYKGLDASLVGVVPYAAIRLASYDAMKAVWRRSTGRKDIDPQAALAFGALAGVSSAVVTYPLEVARRRMMAGAPHANVAAALGTIAATEGVAALFNGVLLSAVLKQAPQMAITFATFEMAKRFLEL